MHPQQEDERCRECVVDGRSGGKVIPIVTLWGEQGAANTRGSWAKGRQTTAHHPYAESGTRSRIRMKRQRPLVRRLPPLGAPQALFEVRQVGCLAQVSLLGASRREHGP